MPAEDGFPAPVEDLSDEELKLRYIATNPGADGEVFIEIYSRFRNVIRSEMERLGLSPERPNGGLVPYSCAALLECETTQAPVPRSVSIW